MCTTKHTTKYTSVTIMNWGFYQNQGTSNNTALCTATGHQRDTNNNYNNYNNIIKKVSKKERKERKTTFDEIINSYTENEELRLELKNHLATRKSKKATLTDRAIELSLKKLDQMAQDESTKIKIVQQSIERGWVGFFPLKETNEKVTGNPFFDMIGGER